MADAPSEGFYVDEDARLLSRDGLELLGGHILARAMRDGEQVCLVDLQVLPEASADPTPETTSARAVRALSQFLRIQLRASDVVARVAPAEVAVLLPDTTKDQALLVIERLGGLVAEIEPSERFSAMAEVGLAMFDPSGTDCDLNALLDAARLDISFTRLRWSI